MTSALNGIISEERRYGILPYTETGENVQIFSDIVNSYGLPGFQGAPWCATYQFAMELVNFGKDQALKNWCMSAETYVGYNCFSTEAAFRRAGRVGKAPRLGALVIFERSHMGRVLSIEGNSFTCGEGNTSNRQYDRNGDSCAVKTYAANDPGIRSFCYIQYEDKMDANQIISATRAVYEMAHNGGYKHGDSHSLPPCADGVISCDRLAARALWNLGKQDQPRGGFTVLNADQYLMSYGAQRITDPNACRAGDIVVMKRVGQAAPTAAWHMFVMTDFHGVGNISKYDMGSQQRIQSAQPFRGVPLNEWPGRLEFFAAYRFGERAYRFTPKDVKMGSTGKSAYLATEILKAYDIKGVRKNGKLQDLELNDRWTSGDMAAMTQWKLDRLRLNGTNLTKGPYGAGEIGGKDWESLLSSGIPFDAVAVPDAQTKGPSVLLAQRILKAQGFGDLVLDAEYGPHTADAIRRWQKAAGRPETGRLNYDDWRVLLRDI